MSYFKLGAMLFASLVITAFVWASESEELREKAEAMQREAAELAEQGHEEEAENLKRHAAEMLEEAEHLERHRPDMREAEAREREERRARAHDVRRAHGDAAPQEIGRRLEHMRMAVDHLRQAGLHEIAQHVVERAERTERELHTNHHRPHEGDVNHAIMKQLEQVRQELHRLRDEVNELKAKR